MLEKCPNCSNMNEKKDKFCKACGTSLLRNKSKKNKILLGIASLFAIIVIGMVYYADNLNFFELDDKEEFIGYTNNNDKFDISMNEDTFILSYLEPKKGVIHKIYYLLQNPENSDLPYFATTPVKYELIITDESDVDKEMEIAKYTKSGFRLENKKGRSILSVEDIGAIEKEINSSGGEFRFFKLEDSLEILYVEDGKTDLILASMADSNGNNEDYIEELEQLILEIIYLGNKNLEDSRKKIDKIVLQQPNSKLVRSYKDLFEKIEKYEQEVQEMNAVAMKETVKEIMALPLSTSFDLSKNMAKINKTNLEFILQVEDLDSNLAAAELALMENDFEAATNLIQIDPLLREFLQNYQPEKLTKVSELEAESEMAYQNTTNLDSFMGYWGERENMADGLNGTILYLSENHFAVGIMQGDLLLNFIENYSIDGNLLKLDLQPFESQMSGKLEPYSLELLLEEESTGNRLRLYSDPDYVYYPVSDDVYSSLQLPDLEEKIDEFYTEY